MSLIGFGLLLHALEIGRVLHIGRAHVPGIGEAARHPHLLPIGVAVEDVAYFVLNIFFVMFLSTKAPTSAARRPDVLEIDGVPLLILAQRLVREVDLQRARERVGDDERRRGEVVGAHVGIHAPLEVAVAREHGGGHDVVVVDRLGDLLRQRPGIADAGGAAEADEVEAELVEVLLQAGFGEIFADHLRARRERGLHPGLGREPFGDGVARQQAGGDHHARVGGVGAGGDRGDHHVAMAEIEIPALDLVALLDARSPS